MGFRFVDGPGGGLFRPGYLAGSLAGFPAGFLPGFCMGFCLGSPLGFPLGSPLEPRAASPVEKAKPLGKLVTLPRAQKKAAGLDTRCRSKYINLPYPTHQVVQIWSPIQQMPRPRTAASGLPKHVETIDES